MGSDPDVKGSRPNVLMENLVPGARIDQVVSGPPDWN